MTAIEVLTWLTKHETRLDEILGFHVSNWTSNLNYVFNYYSPQEIVEIIEKYEADKKASQEFKVGDWVCVYNDYPINTYGEIREINEGRYTIVPNDNGSAYKDIEDAISTIKDLSARYEKALSDVVRLSTKDKWHDLRENPEDLPNEEGSYYCCVEYDGVNEKEYSYYIVTYFNNFWLVHNARWYKVIKWAELPKEREN